MSQYGLTNLEQTPTAPQIFPGLALSSRNRRAMEQALERDDLGLGLLILDMPNLNRLFLLDGDLVGQQTYEAVIEEARHTFSEAFKDHQQLFWQPVGFDECVLLFQYPRKALLGLAKYYALFNTLLSNRLDRMSPGGLGDTLQVVVGFSLLTTSIKARLEQHLTKAYCEAKQFSRSIIEKHQLPLRNEFLHLLRAQALSPLYQPVISFKDGKTIGWEAFTRGPKGDHFETPAVFLRFAEQAGSVYELDQICRGKALEKAGHLGLSQKLFLNTHPISARNTSFSQEAFASTLRALRYTPSSIVLEFSCSSTYTDPGMLKQIIQPYRDLGCGICIDDLGSGGDSLSLLCTVQPEYIKLNRNQVRGVDSDPAKRLMVKTLLKLAEQTDAALIAVGIETQAELSALVSMGVQGGQGLLLGEPCSPKQDITVKLPASATFELAKDEGWICSNPVGNITEKGWTAAPHNTVRELKTRFGDSNPTYSAWPSWTTKSPSARS